MFLMAVSALPPEDEEFFLELYKKYYPYGKKIAKDSLHDKTLQEDAVQAAFISLIPKIELLRSFECYKIEGYVVSTIRRKCQDFNKHSAVERKYDAPNIEGDDNSWESLEEISVDLKKSDPQNIVEERGTYKQIGKIFSQLPEKYRDLLLLKYFYGFNNEEIAKQLKIKKESVCVYVQRAKNFVKKHWTREEFLR